MNRTIVVILLFLTTLTFISCSDSPSSIGSDLLTDDNIIIGGIDSYKDSINQRSSYFRDIISLGSSSRLFLGKKNNLEASILLKFYYVLPDSLSSPAKNDSLVVIQAKVRLQKGYLFGKNDESQPLDYTVHRVNSNWTVGYTQDSLSMLNFDLSDISSDRSFSDTLYSFLLNTDEALRWIKETADTSLSQSKGIYIQPSQSSQKIVGFEAFSQGLTNFATLETIVETLNGQRDTIYAALIADVSILKENTPLVFEKKLVMQSGAGYMSKLFFDISAIPKNAVINNAELILTKDTLSSVLGDDFTKELAAFFVTDSTANSLDSTISVTLSPNDSIYSGLITSYVQRWQSGESNQGLQIVPAGLIEGLELFILEGSDAVDISKRPRLKITYTTIRQ